jgi:uncharacterized protein YcbK (DUF882 family)
VTKAVREYNAEQRQSRQLTLDAAQATLSAVKADLQKVVSTRQKIKADLEAAQAQMVNPQFGNVGIGAPQLGQLVTITALQDRLAQNDNDLRAAQAGLQNAVVGVATEMAKIASDPHYAIEQRFKRLREEASGSIKDVDKLAARLTVLDKQEKAAYDALAKAKRDANKAFNPLAVGVSDVAHILGVTPTSGTRSAKHNAEVGGATNSFHISGQAIDFPLGKWSKELIRTTLERAGIRILELLGPGDKGHSDHFHVAFAKTRKSPEDVADAAQRAAAAAERKRDEAIRRTAAFADASAQLDGQLLQAKSANVTDAGQLAEIARQQVRVESDKLRADIEAKRQSGDYTGAGADYLESLVRQTKAQKLLALDIQEMQRIADEALRVQSAANDNQRDILQVQEGLATTAQERRTIALRLLDLDEQEERARQEAVIASKTATDVEKKIAQARFDALGGIYSQRREGTLRQTRGPMEAYLNDLPHTADQINEALENIKVERAPVVHRWAGGCDRELQVPRAT